MVKCPKCKKEIVKCNKCNREIEDKDLNDLELKELKENNSFCCSNCINEEMLKEVVE